MQSNLRRWALPRKTAFGPDSDFKLKWEIMKNLDQVIPNGGPTKVYVVVGVRPFHAHNCVHVNIWRIGCLLRPVIFDPAQISGKSRCSEFAGGETEFFYGIISQSAYFYGTNLIVS